MARRERYSRVIADGHRKKKQEEATARVALRAERTDVQQIKKLDVEGRTATKERARLQARIDRGGSKNFNVTGVRTGRFSAGD